MRSIPPTATGPSRLPAWSVAEGPFGIRLLDVGIVALVIVAIEVNVIVGTGPGAVPLNIWAYLGGALLAVPILFRHRWPFRVMIASAALIFLYYIFARRNISPAPVFFVPLYDATVAGYLIWAVTIAAGFMITGLVVVEVSTSEGLATLFADFLSQIVILALAVTVGEVVRSRQALAAETARRLRLAEEERAAESGRVVAEERLRIARELHDTVAHSMATITVQAGSALHLLGGGTSTSKPPHDPGLGSPAPSSGHEADADKLRAALTAIRETSKDALTEMRSVLGQLRRSDPRDPGIPDDAGPPDADPASQTGHGAHGRRQGRERSRRDVQPGRGCGGPGRDTVRRPVQRDRRGCGRDRATDRVRLIPGHGAADRVRADGHRVRAGADRTARARLPGPLVLAHSGGHDRAGRRGRLRPVHRDEVPDRTAGRPSAAGRGGDHHEHRGPGGAHRGHHRGHRHARAARAAPGAAERRGDRGGGHGGDDGDRVAHAAARAAVLHRAPAGPAVAAEHLPPSQGVRARQVRAPAGGRGGTRPGPFGGKGKDTRRTAVGGRGPEASGARDRDLGGGHPDPGRARAGHEPVLP